MSQPRRFGGRAGDILWGALHPSALFAGATIGAMVLALGWLMLQGGAARAMPLVLQALLSVILARIALNTAFDGEPGGIFHSPGPSWADAGRTALRFFLLNLVWTLPAVAVTRGPWALGLGGTTPSPAQSALILVLAALPPLQLIAAVAAHRSSELLDPGFWRDLFAGRAAEVAVVYALFFGGLALATVGSLLGATALGAGRAGWTFLLLLGAGSYGGGVFLLLLGRLVGGFVHGAEAAIGEESSDEILTDTADDFVDIGVHPAATFGAETEPDDRPSGAWLALVEGDFAAAADLAAAERARQVVSREKDFDGPLASRSERLRANARRAADDPQGALEEVQRWIESEGPHPLFLIRRTELHVHLGDEENAGLTETIAIARRAGAVGALSELYLHDPETFETSGYQPGDALKMAESLLTHRRPWDAAQLFLRGLRDDPECLSAIKGIIGIADRALDGDTDRALELLGNLDEVAPGHAFADYVADLREDAERRLSRAR